MVHQGRVVRLPDRRTAVRVLTRAPIDVFGPRDPSRDTWREMEPTGSQPDEVTEAALEAVTEATELAERGEPARIEPRRRIGGRIEAVGAEHSAARGVGGAGLAEELRDV